METSVAWAIAMYGECVSPHDIAFEGRQCQPFSEHYPFEIGGGLRTIEMQSRVRWEEFPDALVAAMAAVCRCRPA